MNPDETAAWWAWSTPSLTANDRVAAVVAAAKWLPSGRWFFVPGAEPLSLEFSALTDPAELLAKEPSSVPALTSPPADWVPFRSRVLSDDLFPGGEAPDEWPFRLAEASGLAADLFESSGIELELTDPRLAAAVVALLHRSGLDAHSVSVVLREAASWLRRTIDLGDEPAADATPEVQHTMTLVDIVTGARLIHTHVVQLCGPSTDTDRINYEAFLYDVLADEL